MSDYKLKLLELFETAIQYSEATQHIQWLIWLETKQEGWED